MEFFLAASLIFSPLLSFPNVEEYFTSALGKKRYEAIKEKYDVHPNNSNFIREKDLVKIVFAAAEPYRADLQRAIEGVDDSLVSEELKELIKCYEFVEDLPADLFHRLYSSLSVLNSGKYSVNLELPSMESKILGSIHYWMEFFRYDPIWSLARRKNTAHLNPKLSKEKFYERLSGFYASCEDLEVGQYIRAQDKDEKPRYLRIAGKLITGDGQITWLFKGATKDMSEDILRVSAGTPEKPSGLDSYSHYLTDLEMEIGKMGYESGLPYHKDMQLLIDRPVIEIGYSIGGVFAQYRAVDEFSNVKELWTFKSPGVPLKVINEFENEKSEKVFFPIYVYIAKKDFVSSLGGRHLGCANVDNLDVHVVEMTIPKILPHRYYEDTFERVQMTLLPGGPIALEKYYSNSKIENFRQKSAKYVARPFLMTIGAGWRKVMPNRLKKKRGLWYEVLDNGCHSVCHIVV